MSKFAANFSHGAPDLKCPLCWKEDSIDFEDHSYQCEIIQTLIPEIINKNPNDIYSNNVKVMKEANRLFTQVLDVRSDLIN